jgi:hypothetical protein
MISIVLGDYEVLSHPYYLDISHSILTFFVPLPGFEPGALGPKPSDIPFLYRGLFVPLTGLEPVPPLLRTRF